MNNQNDNDSNDVINGRSRSSVRELMPSAPEDFRLDPRVKTQG